jgi:hypothetical protein
MKLQQRETGCHEAAFEDARGDVCPRRAFRCGNIATSLIQRGPPAATEQKWRSRQHLQLPIQCPEHDMQSEKRIQSP